MAWRKGSFYLPRKTCVTSLAKKNVSIHGRCKSKTSFVGIKFEAENWCATVNNCRFTTKEDPNVDWQIFHSFKHQCSEYFWSTNCNCFSVKLAFLFWKIEKKLSRSRWHLLLIWQFELARNSWLLCQTDQSFEDLYGDTL